MAARAATLTTPTEVESTSMVPVVEYKSWGVWTMGGRCERASCYARANLPRTIPKSYWSWPVAICKGSVPTCTVVSPNTNEVHVPRRLYACPMKTEVPDWHVSEGTIETKTYEVKS